jgi:hypothetical protein
MAEYHDWLARAGIVSEIGASRTKSGSIDAAIVVIQAPAGSQISALSNDSTAGVPNVTELSGGRFPVGAVCRMYAAARGQIFQTAAVARPHKKDRMATNTCSERTLCGDVAATEPTNAANTKSVNANFHHMTRPQ